MRRRTDPAPDTAADPFRERVAPACRTRLPLLGGVYDFECETAELRELVDWAYARLPPQRLTRAAPRFRVRVGLAPRSRPRRQTEPLRVDTLSGAGLLCGTTSSSDFAIVSPAQRAALVVLSQQMLRFPYYARYELLEFAVYTLATRAHGLMPLHAACIGREGRGLLLLGDTGAGKSTASLHCALRGLEFLAEDSVLVAPDTLLATGVANFLHIRRDSLRFVPPLSASVIRNSSVIRRRSGVEKFEVDLRRPEFRLAPRPLKIVALVFVSPRLARTRQLLTPVRRREALGRFRSTQPYAASRSGWTTFSKRLAGTPALELRRGRHPSEAAEALEGLLADHV